MPSLLPCSRALFAFAFSAVLLGCGTEPPASQPLSPPQPSAAAQPAADAAIDRLPSPAEQGLPEVGVISGMMLGDRACYVSSNDSAGTSIALMAVMEFCERDDLIGHSVRFQYEAGLVAAESCQGDPECGESENVQLVIDAELAP